MKLARLHLLAFGPFTDKIIDFASHGTNLHLIYGPNEAGKSSALRAMTDLRFGIPTRSPDDFVHPYERMRVAGVFIDRQGESVGFARRKGRSPTLSRFDPAAAATAASVPVTQADERGLNGGLDRGAFESMFGLDHQRLRAGGDLLLKGEGELGAALFEASAGTQGIAKLLAALDDDAKKFYNPHGRTTTAIINEARRTLDDARQGLRQALTRPADWQALHRAHEEARAKLTDATKALEASRRRENALTELRTVEPLMRDYDRVRAELDELADSPALVETARDERLAAQQSLARAEHDAREAALAIDQLTESIDSIVIEARVLEHGDAIERLASAIEAGVRSRLEAEKAQSVAERIEADLATIAARIAPGGLPSAMLAAVPSSADRVALNGHLSALLRIQGGLDKEVEQAQKLRMALADDDGAARPPADAAARSALLIAVRRAQALGDVGLRVREVERQLKTHEGELKRLLSELRIDDLAALTRSRPLLGAQIQQMRQAMLDIEESARSDRDEDVRLARDLDEQRLRLRQLSATGEVITAATLRDARARRDDAWMAVRHVYIDRDVSPIAGIVAAFEAAQSDADRQADLLRADAARAAEFAHCSGRIEQMRERRAQLAQAQIVLDARRSALEQVWKDTLRDADLPELDAESLKEWQGRRSDALQAFDRLTDVRGEVERIRNEGAEGFNAVVSALHLAGAPALGAPNEDVAARLAKATEHALEWERQASRGDALREARAKVQREQRTELTRLDDSIAKSTRESEAHRAALQAWCGRFFLDRHAEPDAVRARLEELDAFARKADELAEARLRQRNHQLGIDDLDRQVRALCDLIDEPMPTLVEDFAERLRKRLAIARDSDRQRMTLTRELAQANGRRQRAATERVQHAARLEQLCRNAGVTAIDELPACEEKAHRKHGLAGRLAALRQQLADASSSSEQGLRERLAGQDAASMKFELERIGTDIARQDAELAAVRQAEEIARHALEAIDTADTAAAARESMEAAAARLRSAIRPWARLRLAHALLREALSRFRERAQAPMIAAASIYFTLITGGAFVRLVADDSADKPVLRAERAGGAIIGVEAMSEGTADQLYLALRLAALELRRGSHPDMPLVLDDVLITSDDTRATNILKALERFATESQVVIFTHHRHLIDVAGAALPASVSTVHML